MSVLLNWQVDAYAASPLDALDFGWGPEYPKRVRFSLSPAGVVDSLTLEHVESLEESVTVEYVDAETYDVEVSQLGTYAIRLSGSYSDAPRAGAESGTWQTEVGVEVSEVARVDWAACDVSSPAILPGRLIPSSKISLYDDQDRPRLFDNAEPSRSATFTVVGTPETRLWTNSGLHGLVAEGPEQTLTVSTHAGHAADILLLDPSRIDAIATRYTLCSPDGSEYQIGSGRTIPAGAEDLQIIARLNLLAGEHTLCTLFDQDTFDVHVSTPQQCDLTEGPQCPTSSGDIGVSYVLGVNALGRCEAEFGLPNASLSSSLDVTLEPLEE
jgi:hypothetical protein